MNGHTVPSFTLPIVLDTLTLCKIVGGCMVIYSSATSFDKPVWLVLQ